MKAVNFPEANVTLAKDQPQYIPLPVRRLKDGTTTSCWVLEPHDVERFRQILNDPSAGEQEQRLQLFVTQLTFNQPLQPLCVSLDLPPDCFTPKTEAEIKADVYRPDESDAEYAARRARELGVSKSPSLPAEAGKRSSLKITAIAGCKGLSAPFLWGMDTKSRPGIAICHFVRLETQHLTHTPSFDAAQFSTLHPNNDPRLAHLAECFEQANVTDKQALGNLVKVLVLAEQCLAQVKGNAVMQAGTSRFVDDTSKLLTQALKVYAP
jgi:hypothetical protein